GNRWSVAIANDPRHFDASPNPQRVEVAGGFGVTRDTNGRYVKRVVQCVCAEWHDSNYIFFVRSERQPATALDQGTRRNTVIRHTRRRSRCEHDTVAGSSLGGMEHSPSRD